MEIDKLTIVAIVISSFCIGSAYQSYMWTQPAYDGWNESNQLTIKCINISRELQDLNYACIDALEMCLKSVEHQEQNCITHPMCHIYGTSQGEDVDFYVDAIVVDDEYICTYNFSEIYPKGESIEPSIDDELSTDVIIGGRGGDIPICW